MRPNAFLRGWDDLFTKCSENLNSLVAMKLSPYYKGTTLSIISIIYKAHMAFVVFEEEVITS